MQNSHSSQRQPVPVIDSNNLVGSNEFLLLTTGNGMPVVEKFAIEDEDKIVTRIHEFLNEYFAIEVKLAVLSNHNFSVIGLALKFSKSNDEFELIHLKERVNDKNIIDDDSNLSLRWQDITNITDMFYALNALTLKKFLPIHNNNPKILCLKLFLPEDKLKSGWVVDLCGNDPLLFSLENTSLERTQKKTCTNVPKSLTSIFNMPDECIVLSSKQSKNIYQDIKSKVTKIEHKNLFAHFETTASDDKNQNLLLDVDISKHAYSLIAQDSAIIKYAKVVNRSMHFVKYNLDCIENLTLTKYSENIDVQQLLLLDEPVITEACSLSSMTIKGFQKYYSNQLQTLNTIFTEYFFNSQFEGTIKENFDNYVTRFNEPVDITIGDDPTKHTCYLEYDAGEVLLVMQLKTDTQTKIKKDFLITAKEVNDTTYYSLITVAYQSDVKSIKSINIDRSLAIIVNKLIGINTINSQLSGKDSKKDLLVFFGLHEHIRMTADMFYKQKV